MNMFYNNYNTIYYIIMFKFFHCSFRKPFHTEIVANNFIISFTFLAAFAMQITLSIIFRLVNAVR